MLPPESAETSGAPRPVAWPGLTLVGVRPNALWYHGVGWVVSTPPSLAPSCGMRWPLVMANEFHTASRKTVSPASPAGVALGSLWRPPSIRRHHVAVSPALATSYSEPPAD